MFLNGLFIFTLAVLLLTQTSFSQETPVADTAQGSGVSDVFYLCKKSKNTRWLRAYKLDNGKCKALYSKEGYLQVISSATYFSSCEGVLLSVKKNLEEGSFKCTQMSNASVIELESE